MARTTAETRAVLYVKVSHVLAWQDQLEDSQLKGRSSAPDSSEWSPTRSLKDLQSSSAQVLKARPPSPQAPQAPKRLQQEVGSAAVISKSRPCSSPRSVSVLLVLMLPYIYIYMYVYIYIILYSSLFYSILLILFYAILYIASACSQHGSMAPTAGAWSCCRTKSREVR